MLRTILIDPENRSFTEIEYSGDYRDIYEYIDADTFDVVYSRFGDIFVDDEGLLKEPEYFFEIDGVDQPLAGKGLLFGRADDEGNSTSSTMTIDDLEKVVRFTTRQKLIASLG